MEMPDWPLLGLRLRCREVELRLVREEDLPYLAASRPPDYEHHPRAEMFDGLDPAQNGRRLTCQEFWRSRGTWSPSSWCLDLAVEHAGVVVGVQSLEGEDFPVLRTVDSGSWLIPAVRGRGIGVAMRMAVLGLAFEHLGAVAAITSTTSENAASLGVSRRIGYRDNGVSINNSGHGPIELIHLRLTAGQWRASRLGQEVAVTGFEPCRAWFGLAAPAAG
jgi:RimJ/RimL family protein N-acetyltransferase